MLWLCCLHMWLCAVFTCSDPVLSSHVVTVLSSHVTMLSSHVDSMLSSHVVTVCCLHMLWLCSLHMLWLYCLHMWLCSLHMLWLFFKCCDSAVFTCCDSVLSSHVVTVLSSHVVTVLSSNVVTLLSSHVVTLCCLHMLWLCSLHMLWLCSLHMLWLYMYSSSVRLCGSDFMHSSLFPKSSLKILQSMWSLFSISFMIIWWLWPPVNKICIGFYISSKCFLPISWIIFKFRMSSPQFFTAFEGCESELHFYEHFQEFYIFLQQFFWVWTEQNMTGETNSVHIRVLSMNWLNCSSVSQILGGRDMK